MKNKTVRVYLMIGMVSVFMLGCLSSSNDESIKATVAQIIVLFHEGDFQKIQDDYFTASLKASLSINDLQATWDEHTMEAGEKTKTHETTISEQGNSYIITETEVSYKQAKVHLRMTFDKTSQLVGIHISSDVAERPPDGVVEKEAIIGKDTSYELGGILSLPSDSKENLPAAILVHGSGPSDRNEAVHAYQPFRDIAWGLSSKGIAVLRYDKRTFIYEDQLMSDVQNEFTVYEETVEDAILAGELLRKDERINPDQVFLIGHSLGGMLAPRIATEGGYFSGIISLAGSPRSLWEIIYDQHLSMLDNIKDQAERDKQKQVVDKEYAKAQQLEEMPRHEAYEKVVFGLPAYYLKEMDENDAGELALKLDIPMLFLHGEEDFQVDIHKGFNGWKEILQTKEQTTFISYPHLNHFFIDYQGANKGTLIEYQTPGMVDSDVITDLAEWIIEHSNDKNQGE